MELVVHVIFFLAVLGTKALIAAVFIYYLFPSDGRCPACDDATIPLQTGPGLRLAARLLRLERRWCPHCNDTMLARRRRDLFIRIETMQRSETERIG